MSTGHALLSPCGQGGLRAGHAQIYPLLNISRQDCGTSRGPFPACDSVCHHDVFLTAHLQTQRLELQPASPPALASAETEDSGAPTSGSTFHRPEAVHSNFPQLLFSGLKIKISETI